MTPLFPAGTVLHTTLWHDNSTANRANPDPRNWRGYGQRTMDEMAFLVDDVDRAHRRRLQVDAGGEEQAELELAPARCRL